MEELQDWVESYLHHHIIYKSNGFVKKSGLLRGIQIYMKQCGYKSEFEEVDKEKIEQILNNIFGDEQPYYYNNELLGYYGYEIENQCRIKKIKLEDTINHYLKIRIREGEDFYTEKGVDENLCEWYKKVMCVKTMKWRKHEYIPVLLNALEKYKVNSGYNLLINTILTVDIEKNENMEKIKNKKVKYEKNHTVSKKEIFTLFSYNELKEIMPKIRINWPCELNNFEDLAILSRTSFGNLSEKLLTINLLQNSSEEVYIKREEKTYTYKELWECDYIDKMLYRCYKDENYEKLLEKKELLEELKRKINIVSNRLRSNNIKAQELFEYKTIRIKPDLIIDNCIYDIKESSMTYNYIFDQVLYLVIGRELGYDLNEIGFISPSINYIVIEDLSEWINSGGCKKFQELLDIKLAESVDMNN